MTTTEYTGKICPYCKSPIKEGDDIVVCSACEMPHHKDCWVDNQGCTTVGCAGAITYPGAADADNDSFEIDLYDEQPLTDFSSFPGTEGIIYCGKCGMQNPSQNRFCIRCGSPLSSPSNTVETSPASLYNASSSGNTVFENSAASISYPGISRQGPDSYINNPDKDADMSLLIGKNTEYYLPRFRDMKYSSKKSSWNWCAFLFTPYWLVYRKMYAYGLAFLGFSFLAAIIGGLFLSLLSLSSYIIFGVLGNYIYMQFLEKKASQFSMLSGTYKADFASKNGGTNIIAVILCLIGYVVLTAAASGI